MRTATALVLTIIAMLFFVPAAHAQSATARLTGVWKMDKEKSIAAMKKQGNEEYLDDLANLAGLSIHFQTEGRYKITQGQSEESGKWQVVRKTTQKGKLPQAVVEIGANQLGRKQTAVVKFLDANIVELTLSDPDDKLVVILNRLQKNKK